ncbi:MAG: hypothetical protein AAGD33_23690 [Actinomycetota bacterium]
MYAVATFLVVATLSLVFTQVAAGALIATGLPADVARFQARSAFTGAGFTTTEAESVVKHPIRRRIVATTMFVGALGTPTLVVTVLIGFIAPGPGNTRERTLVILSGLLLVLMSFINRPMQRWLAGIGQQHVRDRLLPNLDDDIVELCSIDDDFQVASVRVVGDPGPGTLSLRGIDESFPHVRVLGIRHDGGFLGEPPVDAQLHDGDSIVVYGRRDDLLALDSE